MTQEHPIAPLPSQELVQQWTDDWTKEGPHRCGFAGYIATRAAQWGTDQAETNIERERQEAADEELEACIEVIKAHGWFADPEHRVAELRDARRPKPKSLKEQAIALIDSCADPDGDYLDDNALSTIRRALKSIPDEQ